MIRKRYQYAIPSCIVAAILSLIIAGCMIPSIKQDASGEKITFIAVNGGLAGMKVTANSKELSWWYQRTADDGSSIPNAAQYVIDVYKAKYSEAARAAKGPTVLYRISGTTNPNVSVSGKSSNPKIWLDDVTIELANE
jgi:hypothetical protein